MKENESSFWLNKKEKREAKKGFPVCGWCNQTININDPELVYMRYKGKAYHEDCLKMKLAKEKEKTPEEIIFREAPLGKQTDVDSKEHIVFKSDS
jgi:uncharacterized protein (DUF2225 family)